MSSLWKSFQQEDQMHRLQKVAVQPREAKIHRPVLNPAIALAITAFFSAPAAFAKDDLGPGCAPDRPAVAHRAGGVLLHGDNNESTVIPCSTATGWRTSEPSIVVTNDGTVLFQPTFTQSGLAIGLIRSVDRGE